MTALRLVALVGLIGVALTAASCADERKVPAIQVRDADVVVQNQTDDAWTDVQVWVNYHFRQTAPGLEQGQVFVVPLNMLVAAYGQRFDRSRQAVFGVEVTARSRDGRPVRLTWGKTARH